MAWNNNVPTQVAVYVFGGVFLGAWLYFLIFADAGDVIDRGAWALWGFVGLAIAAALYIARIASDWVRIGMFVLVGICIGLLFFAAIDQESEEMFAFLLTAAGAGLIAAALPRMTPAN